MLTAGGRAPVIACTEREVPPSGLVTVSVSNWGVSRSGSVVMHGWNWLVGSGIYVDDVAAAARASLLRNSLMALAIALLLLGLSLWQAHRIVRPLCESVDAATGWPTAT